MGVMGDCVPYILQGAPGYTVGWSCPVSTWPHQESPQPISTEVWADLSQCLDHKLLCPRWSTRSRIRPLEIDAKTSNEHNAN